MEQGVPPVEMTNALAWEERPENAWPSVVAEAGHVAPWSIQARSVSTSLGVSLGPDKGMKRLGSTLETIWINLLSALLPGLIAGPE